MHCFSHLEQFLVDLVDELSALVGYYDLGATIPGVCMHVKSFYSNTYELNSGIPSPTNL